MQFKSLLLLLTLAAMAVADLEAPIPGPDDVVTIIAGMMKGVINKDDLKQLQECFDKSQVLSTDVTRIVKDL